MKIHNRCTFHLYSIWGCQVKNFQSFSCWSSIHEMALLGRFLDPYSPKCCPVLQKKFSRSSFQGEKNGIEKIFVKFRFLKKPHLPKVCTFGTTLTNLFFWPSLKLQKVNGTKWMLWIAIGLSKYEKVKALSPLLFPEKMRLLFGLFWLFLTENRAWSYV